MAYNKLNSELLKSYDDEKEILNLEEAALRFIHNRCTGLRYDSEVEKKEQTEKINLGTSIGEKQIPYNMQMDIDRLCLENAVKRFLDSGVTIDAFDVYFCFSEMFLGDYRNTGAMVELLSEFENNGSSVLMKHRDHYAHSVYVFVLGLAIYETNNEYRKAYAKTYELDNDTAAAHHFIKYWGTASLFHDIGYPMELPFEQATSYFEVNSHEREKMPFMSYSCMDEYVKISEPLKREISKIDGRIFNTTNELFAGYITKKLAKEYIFNEQDLLEKIADKPTHPEKFNYFMDHAYFSATILFKKLYEDMNCTITKAGIDALTAIILHNSLYKFCIAYYKNDRLNKPLKIELHPLAYLLMICDELQCWDRADYGRNSRGELHPMGCNFKFSNETIQSCYIYDEKQKYKIDLFERQYQSWKDSTPKETKGDPLFDEKKRLWKESKPRVKACSDMIPEAAGQKSEFLKDIERIVDTKPLNLSVDIDWKPRMQSKKHTYLSDSNFLNLYNFAVALNGRWMMEKEWKAAKEAGLEQEFLNGHMDDFNQAFGKLSLEYKLSNLNQAKSFDTYLNEINCF